MLWITLSLATAMTSAVEAAYLKRNYPNLSPLETGFYPNVYSLPYFLVFLIFLDVPELSPQFWQTFFTLLPVNVTGILLYFRAVRMAPLSLTLPYLAFTPAFVILTGFLILGETLNAAGIAGLLFIVLGSYMLNIEAKATGGWFAPFKAIVSEPGSRSALGAAIVFSFASVLGRKGILESEPLFFGTTFTIAQATTIALVLPLFGKARFSCLKQSPGKGLLLGAMTFAHIIFHNYAISLVKTAYMIALKRFNAIFGVIIGALWFKEHGIQSKLIGASLMVAGAAIIGFFGN